MKIKECVTCGAHEFKNGKCAYCGNQYEADEVEQYYADDENSFGEPVIPTVLPETVKEDGLKLKICLSIVFGLAVWFVALVALPAIVLPLTFIAIGFIIWKLLKK